MRPTWPRTRRQSPSCSQPRTPEDRYRDLLVAQFTAMEKVVGGLKATGNFLTQQENVNHKG